MALPLDIHRDSGLFGTESAPTPSASMLSFPKKRLSSCSSLAFSFSSLSTSLSSNCSTFSPSSPLNTPPAQLFNPIVFSSTGSSSQSSSQSQPLSIDFSVDPKSRTQSSSQLHRLLAPINIPTPPESATGINYNSSNLVARGAQLNWRIRRQIRQLVSSVSFHCPIAKLKGLVESTSATRSRAQTSLPASSSHLTEQQMLQCLDRYFGTYHLMYPMLDPDAWSRKAKTAWRALEYGSILSFNQIELAIVYLLVALGASETADASGGGGMSGWSAEYYLKTKCIIPNVHEVPICLSITQYMVLSSMYLAVSSIVCPSQSTGDNAEVSKLSYAAVKSATALGLHTLIDSTKYVDLPALNALESHRTWIGAYLWNEMVEATIASNIEHSEVLAASATTVTMNTKAFLDIGYHNSSLIGMRMKLSLLRVDYLNRCAHTPCTTEEIERSLSSTVGDKSLFLQSNPPANISSGIASKLNRSMSKEEWYHFRIVYWYTRVALNLPFLIASACATQPGFVEAQEFRKGSDKCVESASELVKLLTSGEDGDPTGTFIDWKRGIFFDKCSSIFLFHALCCVPHPNLTNAESVKTLNQCVEVLGCSSDPFISGLLSMLGGNEAIGYSLDKLEVANLLLSRNSKAGESASFAGISGLDQMSLSPCSTPKQAISRPSTTPVQVWPRIMSIFI